MSLWIEQFAGMASPGVKMMEGSDWYRLTCESNALQVCPLAGDNSFSSMLTKNASAGLQKAVQC